MSENRQKEKSKEQLEIMDLADRLHELAYRFLNSGEYDESVMAGILMDADDLRENLATLFEMQDQP